jgi:hypothetical protein
MGKRGRKSKYSDEIWKEAYDYYQEGHTLAEVTAVYGMSVSLLSNGFRDRGWQTRAKPKLEEIRGLRHKPRPVETPVVEEVPVPTEPPKRRVINLSGNGGSGVMLYEKFIGYREDVDNGK